MRISSFHFPIITMLGMAGRLTAGVPEDLRVTRVIDFEGEPAMAWTQYEYRVSAPSDNWIQVQKAGTGSILSDNGSQELFLAYQGSPVTITHLDGTEFQLLQLDLAEYSTVAVPGVVRFQGRKSDGSTINFAYQIDGITDGTGPKKDFETVVFPAEWTGLIQVQILSEKVAIDNIQVRGMKVTDFGSAMKPASQLTPVAMLASAAGFNSWSVNYLSGDQMILSRYDPANNSNNLCRFNLTTRKVEAIVPVSSTAGGDPLTGEIATVANGILTLQGKSGPTTMAQVGRDSVNRIGYPAVSNGSVAFVNHFYTAENYAVFVAGPAGVRAVVTPDTVLSDGSKPYYFPYQLFFRGNTLAFPTSTGTSGECFVVCFNQGAPKVTPGTAGVIPGTAIRITGIGNLLWLDDSSIAYSVESNPTGNQKTEGIVVMKSDGSVEGYAVPPNLVKTVLPGAGGVERISGIAGFDQIRKVAFSSGTLESLDLGPNNLSCIVAHPDAGAFPIAREQDVITEFGTLVQLATSVVFDETSFYVTGLNDKGQIFLLKSKRFEPRASVQTGPFVPTTDGTVRFMVDHLTHGRSYRIERTEDLTQPWQESSRFIGGSQTRSVLGSMARRPREFFRVVEE